MDGQEHLVWTPIGWIEASAVVVFLSYRALDPNAGSKRPQQRLSVWGVRVSVSAITEKKSKEDHCRPTSVTWYMSHVGGSGMPQGFMQKLFLLPQPIDRSHRG